MASFSARKAGRKRVERGTFKVMMFVSRNLCMMGIAFLGMAKHLPGDKKQLMDSLLCFACVNGTCCTQLTIFMSTLEFLHFTFPILSPIASEEDKKVTAFVSYLLGLNHNKSVESIKKMSFLRNLKKDIKKKKKCF